MAKPTRRRSRNDQEDGYLKLVRTVALRPIRSDAELVRAVEMIDSLVIRDDLDPGEEDYLDVLGDLVRKYEAVNIPMPAVSDAEMLRFLLDSNEISQSTLAQRSGIAESTISEILAGKRRMSRRHILAISALFNLSPAAFFPQADAVMPVQSAVAADRPMK